ncbi:FAD-dependent monooxygenase [Streptomyces sp. 4N509B]|uniref:FAD-dependent monooxygenase n=1 Tax=Streptomyces sp. 4N509B TaxID=3457413 RepID=UPI003FD412A9
MSTDEAAQPAGATGGDDPEVLIVGAGPVGMVLACELLQQGVRIRLIDQENRAEDTDPHSRGILVWPRSLEILRRVGVAERLAALGHQSPHVNYYSEHKLRGAARLDRHPDSPYPFVLTLPQRDTERVLRERVAELGGRIEHGVSLVDLDNAGPRPRATLRHADGVTEEVSCEYLVGVDGPSSRVRSHLGIRFDGDPIDVTYAIGDAPVVGDLPAEAQYYYHRTGVVALVPLRNGHYRIAANIPHRGEDEPDPPATMLEEIIRGRAGLDVTVGEPDWTRSFRPRMGLAERYRVGRCLIAGDAAHVISPAGGQGMNVGLQDAVNLGWKLGGVLRGRLDAAILDTYEPERSVAAERMSRTSAAQARFALQRTTWGILRRDTVFRAARLLGVLQRILVPLLSQTDVHYGDHDSTPIMLRDRNRRRLEPGRRVPLFAGPDLPDGTPALDLHRYTVVCWPGRRAPRGWGDTVARHRGRLAESAAVVDLAGLPRPAAAKLRRAFGRRPVVGVVRPDGHLAFLTTDLSGGPVADHLRGTAPRATAVGEPVAVG